MTYQICPICNGTGVDQCQQGYSGTFVCPTCNGKRIINEVTGLPPGQIEETKTPILDALDAGPWPCTVKDCEWDGVPGDED